MNTIENNKIIAKFMGMEQGKANDSRWKNDWFEKLVVVGNGFEAGRRHERLHFHSSWDWLMEVVEKIESLDYSVDIFNKAVSIQCNTKTQMIVDLSGRTDNSKLSQVYEAVVEFIKYKN